MQNLRKKIGREEFDYQALKNALSNYANPREKITSLMAKGVIIRVKKGLYVFGEDYRLIPYSKEYLANMIYGPSYVSLEYSLSHYGLIPERVETMTSMCVKKARMFHSPVGVFEYRHTPVESFSVGLRRVENDTTAYLMASPEKALADKIKDDRGVGILNLKEMEKYLFDHLRVEPQDFFKLDVYHMEEIAQNLSSKKVGLCAKLLKRNRIANLEPSY